MKEHRRFLALPIALGLAVALVTPVAALAAEPEESTVTVVGSGWGHGVGLSQYGAYGASRDGWSVAQILSHFYKGSSIGVIGEGNLSAAEPLWVNLEMDQSSLELIAHETNLASPQPVVVTRGSDSWELGKDHRLLIDWDSAAGTCAMEIQGAGGAPLAEQPGSGPCNVDITWDGWVDKPSRKIEIEGCEMKDWNSGFDRPCEYARGDLHLRVGPGGMDLTVEVDIDDYVLGISEMPYYWGSSGGLEALKSQAIAARSYARELQISRDEPGNNVCAAWCDVRDTTWDQRYVGWGHAGDGIDDWIAATSATAGQVVTHPDAPNGGIVRAYYSSSSGGATENAYEVWSKFGSPVEYWSSADDHWALDDSINRNALWTASFSADYVAAKVGLDVLESAAVVARNTSTSARTVRFTGIKDGEPITVDEASAAVKSDLGLKSIYFSITFGQPGPFSDIANSVHYEDIAYIADLGITKGCNPPFNTEYCPSGLVTRGEMAAFLVRSLDLSDDGGKDWFTDDNGTIFESDINKLAAAGITKGCNDAGTEFCQDDPVTRGEMAAFLVRGFGYADSGAGDWFEDDDGSIFEADIDRLKVAGVTVGCNPPSNTNFCPDDAVARGPMASFLARALNKLT